MSGVRDAAPVRARSGAAAHARPADPAASGTADEGRPTPRVPENGDAR